MSIKNLLRIAIACAGLGAATLAQAAICQFIPASGNWDVPANWANCTGGNGAPAGTPGPADRAEITGRTAILPAGTFNVGDLYLGSATIQGAGIAGTTLNVVAAGTIAWGSGFYTFQNLTITFVGAAPIPAANGPMTVDTAVLILSPSTTMSADSLSITGTGAKFSNGGIFNPSSAVTSGAGAEFDNEPGADFVPVTPLTITGTFVNKGNFVVNASAPVTLNSAAQFSQPPGMTASISGNGTLTGTGQALTLDGGYITFTPTLNFGSPGVINNGAIVQPGGPGVIGTITINGNYAHGAGAGLEIEVSKNSTVIVYDRLVVTNTASISPASVVFNYINTGFGAYTTTQGDTLDFMAFGNFTGGFGGFSAPATANSTSINYTATAAQFVVGPPVGPVLSVSGSGSFPLTAVGGTSGVQFITISNTGTANLVLSSISASNPLVFSDTVNGPPPQAAQWCGFGSDPMGFPIPTGGPITLAPGASCQLVLNFKPAAATTYSETITIASNDPSSPKVIALDGIGAIGASATLTPALIDFGNATVGFQTAPQTATFTNTSATSLTASIISAGPHFSVVGTTCSGPIAPGGSCTIDVVALPPPTPGFYTSAVQVTTTPLSNNPSAVVQFTGVPAAITLSPDPVNIADTPVSWTRALFLAAINNTATAVTFSPPLLMGAPEFSVSVNQVPNCATGTIPAFGECDFIFNFTPTATGSYFTTFILNTSAGTFNTNVNANGIATIPLPTVSPATVNFTATNVGSSSANLPVTFSNPAGGATVQLQSLGGIGGTDAADFVLASDPCSNAFVNPGASCVLQTTFSPLSTTGAKTASLNYLAVEPSGAFVNIGFALAGTATAGSAPSMTVAFAPTSISVAGTTILTVTLNNPLATSAFISAGSLTLPAGLSGTPPGTNSCGTFGSFAGQTYSFGMGSIPALGSCTIDITVTSVVAGTYTVNVPAGALTAGSSNTNTSSAGLTVLAAAAPAITSASTASGVQGTAFSYTITATNTPTAYGATGLPAGLNVNTATGVISGVPTVSGSFVVSLSATNANGTGTGTVTITVIASTSPIASLSQTLVTFGNQTVNTTSAATIVTLSNPGTAALFISGITVTGDFGFTSNCPTASAPLAIAGSCAISITFTPLSIAALTGTITITSNAPGSPHTISLTGTGVGTAVPVLTLAANTVNFPDTVVGTSSAYQTLLVTNTGLSTLNFSAISVSGPFSRLTGSTVPLDCGASLAPGASCQIWLSFNPVIVVSVNGQLSITHNAAGSPTLVALSGLGISLPAPSISVTKGLAFGDQVLNTTATQALAIGNAGTATLNISSVTLSGADASSYRLAGACTSVPVGGTCTLNVTFTPASLGAKAAQLTIVSDSGSSLAGAAPSVISTVALSGNGIRSPLPVASLNLSVVGFGNSIFAGASSPQPVTLTNTGSAVLSISNIVVGPDFLQMNNCGSTLASAVSCTINVAFSPLGLGPRAGELQVFSNALGSPHRVTLSGTGCRWFSQAQSRFFLTTC